jgi:hypothetical protein
VKYMLEGYNYYMSFHYFELLPGYGAVGRFRIDHIAPKRITQLEWIVDGLTKLIACVVLH